MKYRKDDETMCWKNAGQMEQKKKEEKDEKKKKIATENIFGPFMRTFRK